MWDALKALLKQPLWIITVVLGTIMVALPCVTKMCIRDSSKRAPRVLDASIVEILEILVARENDSGSRRGGVILHPPFDDADLATANSRPHFPLTFLYPRKVKTSLGVPG